MLVFRVMVCGRRWGCLQGTQWAVGWKLIAVTSMVEPSHPTDIFPTMAIFHHETWHGLEEKFHKTEFHKVMCNIDLFCMRFEFFSKPILLIYKIL